jgi:hypothetical protein
MRWFRVRNANVTPEMRDEFEQAGKEMVRTLLYDAMANPTGLSPTLASIMQPSRERKAAIEWLRERQRAAKVRAGLMDAATIVAMIAACVAAWAVANEWVWHWLGSR